MGLALKTAGGGGDNNASTVIHTVEAFDPQATLAREMLSAELGGMVNCVFGRVGDAVPEIGRSLGDGGRFDFVFHDAGHTYDDYVNDFAAIEPLMAPGSVLLLDDIRWVGPATRTT